MARIKKAKVKARAKKIQKENKDSKAKSFIKEFRGFIEGGNAVDMAVGIIVGSAMTGVVNSLVKDVIMPPIGLLIGGVDFSQLFIVLSGTKEGVDYVSVAAAQAAGATTLNLGMFFNSIISFLITMFAIFLIVRFINKSRNLKKAPEVVTTKVCPYCFTEIKLEAKKCPACTSDLKPKAKKKIIVRPSKIVIARK